MERYGPLMRAAFDHSVLQSRAVDAGPPRPEDYESARAYSADCKVWQKWKYEKEAQEAKALAFQYRYEIEAELDPLKRYREAREEFTAE